MPEIIPTILVESQDDFESRLRLVEDHCDTIQVDIHDGILFKHITWNDARSVGAMKTSVSYELHLMAENPIEIAKAWHEHVPNIVRGIFHVELDRQLGPIIENLKWMDMEAVAALNPETPLEEIHQIIDQLDGIMFMTVHPGLSGQGVGDAAHGITEEALLHKISEAHSRYPDIPIAVDGGITKDNVKAFLNAGVTRFGVGSSVFFADDPVSVLKELQALVK